MRFAAVVTAFLSLAAGVWAANITIKVGANGTLAFDPDNVNATTGDIINFQFLAKNHTVTQSSFAEPCTRLTTPSLGIDSGFQPVAANATTIPQFSFTVENATTPLWFYCKQTGHCQAGMVFAVNPTANKSFDAFKAAATGSNSSSSSPSGSGSTPSSSTGTVATPSASNNPSKGAAPALDPSKLAGIITLVAVLAGTLL